jgi:hypothetical protein
MLSIYGANLYSGVIAGTYVAPTTFYLAILDTIPDVNDNGTALTAYEPVEAEYDRVMIDTGNPEWTYPTGGIALYQTEINYYPVTTWGDYVAYALCDSAVNGEHIMYGVIGNTINFAGGAKVTIPANTLSIQVV